MGFRSVRPANRTDKPARCAAAGPIRRGLLKALRVVFMEFRLQGELPVLTGATCSSLRASWDLAIHSVMSLPSLSKGGKTRKSMRRSKLSSALKSCKRIFDAPCTSCDFANGEIEKEKWATRMSEPVNLPDCKWIHDPYWALRRRVRELSHGWGERLENARKECVGGMERRSESGVYIPDQQGCFEAKKGEGGTLAVHPSRTSEDDSLVRLGVAKTKGKLRVVTMQSARVKRVLTPVHNALYDHLSSFGWLVRGDVKKEDFLAVIGDRREGEAIISGDYESATDRIYLPAVHAIIDELSKDESLTEEERKVLVGSFHDLRWKDPCHPGSATNPIKRGSMMGNLVSFPLLCLLNKACFDITSDISRGSGANRVGRFNGDDCVFSGDRKFFSLWKEVTGTFGLCVNVEKTGFSELTADLNSQSFFIRRGVLAPKPVLSFFRPFRQEPGCLLTEILRGVSTFRGDVKSFVVNSLMRFEISVRQIDLSALTRRDYQILSKKSWFRRAITDGPAPLIKKGVERKVEMIVGPPPKEAFYTVVDALSKDVSRDLVDQWLGVRVKPASQSIDFKSYRERSTPSYQPPSFRVLKRGPRKWSFVWPRPVYEHFLQYGERVFLPEKDRTATWIDDHPFLHVTMDLVRGRFVRGARNFRTYYGPPLSLSPCSLSHVNMGFA
ncbi:RNA-dependent RNA polymerase [Erysiphe necator associated ourmia-like virus 72]|nr:RNA-dependent RNA polymerase [Erysiphe necator associated ourmia-like virus 72]